MFPSFSCRDFPKHHPETNSGLAMTCALSQLSGDLSNPHLQSDLAWHPLSQTSYILTVLKTGSWADAEVRAARKTISLGRGRSALGGSAVCCVKCFRVFQRLVGSSLCSRGCVGALVLSSLGLWWRKVPCRKHSPLCWGHPSFSSGRTRLLNYTIAPAL